MRKRSTKVWHWRRQYFEPGQKVRLYTHYARKLPSRGVVKAVKVNKWGRVNYRVYGSNGAHYNVLLESLLPNNARVAP